MGKQNALSNLSQPSNVTIANNVTAPISNDKQVLTTQADVLDSQGNHAQAIQYLDKALAIDPNDEDALVGKGLALKNEGNYTQAIPLFDKALAIDPKDKVALVGKGRALSGLGNFTQAIPLFDKALAIHALDNKDMYNYIHALNGKGWALNGLSNYAQAIPYFDKALAVDPNYQDALMGKQNALSNLPSTTPSNVTTLSNVTTANNVNAEEKISSHHHIVKTYKHHRHESSATSGSTQSGPATGGKHYYKRCGWFQDHLACRWIPAGASKYVPQY